MLNSLLHDSAACAFFSMNRILFCCLVLAPTVAQAVPVRTEHVEAELVAERTAWLPGAINWVALRLKPEQGWHTYWRNPGDSGLPTTLQWSLPAKWNAGDIHWPYPSVHRLGELVNYGYGEETLHLVPVEIPRIAAQGRASVQALAKWLVCSDICIPGQAELELSLPLSEIATADPVWSLRFQETRQRLPRPEPLPGRFQLADSELHLQIETAGLPPAGHAEFFAYANDLVNHGAPQRSAMEAETARFSQPQSAYLTRLPTTVGGVLVWHSRPARAYAVAAQPGEVTAVPIPAPAVAEAPAPVLVPPTVETPGLALVLGFALLGGLILNLMPCVFPVLSIKAVSVLESRRGDAAAERLHALAYSAGVVSSSVLAAVALIALRRTGESLGWGFQLQSPVFVALLAYLLFALGLSLSGLAQFGTRLMGVGQSLTEQSGYLGSFFTGVLAVVVASPCTAPFMGAALGYALMQPAAIAVIVFATLGLGLALPFLLLGFFPWLGAWLPRPGPWMETFKQLMAFPLYLTVIWLLWVLGRQTDMDGAAIGLLGLVLIAFALWLRSGSERNRLRTLLTTVALAGALALLLHPALRVPATRAVSSAAGEEPYSDRRLAELRAQKRAVFVNFTADWCISCKVNEKVALDNETVRKAFSDKNVVWLTADWTTADPEITAALARFGRSGVPLYLLYPPVGEPRLLPQILTPDILLDALSSVP